MGHYELYDYLNGIIGFKSQNTEGCLIYEIFKIS